MDWFRGRAHLQAVPENNKTACDGFFVAWDCFSPVLPSCCFGVIVLEERIAHVNAINRVLEKPAQQTHETQRVKLTTCMCSASNRAPHITYDPTLTRAANALAK